MFFNELNHSEFVSERTNLKMKTTKCISELLGEVSPDEMFDYLSDNWQNINYVSAIDKLLKNFHDSLKGRAKYSINKKTYENIEKSWRVFISKNRSEIVAGHFDDCMSVGCCKCTFILFDYPREVIGKIIHAYYPTQCITEMIPYKKYEYVL